MFFFIFDSNVSIPKKIADYLTQGHSRLEPWTPRHTHIFLDVMEKRKDSLIQKHFWTLKGSTTLATNLTLLLEKNHELVKQYLIARYLTAESCTSQLYWLLGDEAPELGDAKIHVLGVKIHVLMFVQCS